MQLLAIVLIVLGLLAIVAVWRRVGGANRSEKHAIERHEHALGVLGDVARRAEPPPSVKIVQPSEVAKVHIRPTEEGAAPVPRPTGEDVPPPRVRLEPPTVPGAPLAFGTPVRGTPAVPYQEEAGWEAAGYDEAADDDGDAGEQAPGQPVGAGRRAPGRHARPAARPRRPGAGARAGGAGPRPPRSDRDRLVRRGATAAMALVALALVIVAAVQLAGSGSPARSGGTTTSTRPGGGAGGTTTSTTTSTSVPTTTSTPTTITPVATSASEVSYHAPSSTYTMTFQATAPCWVGIQQTAGGPWVWEETVQAGQQATYHASGPILVRLGAPTQVSITLDGVSVQLPSSNTQAYDLTFTPA